MRKQTLKLWRPDLGDQIEKRYRCEKDGRLRIRLLCVKLAARGEHNASEIAELCGVSRATVFEWVGAFRREGFEALLDRGKPGPRPGELRGLPEAVVEQLRAGFHLRAGDPRLPARVHILSLPPYSPELNPCEQLWDVLKETEGFANGLFQSTEELREALRPGLRRFWEDSGRVLSLVGRPWLHDQANASAKSWPSDYLKDMVSNPAQVSTTHSRY